MRLHRSPLIICLSLLTLVQQSWAALPPPRPTLITRQGLAATYREKTQEVLYSLEAAGVERMACLDRQRTNCLSPRQLLREMETIEFVALDYFDKSPEATRWGAFYDPALRKVYLNAWARHDDDFIGYLGLHEVLGIARAENELRLSILAYLFLHADPTKRDGQTYWTQRDIYKWHMEVADHTPPDRDANGGSANQRLTKGSGVIVGGAGDTLTIALRIRVLEGLVRTAKAGWGARFPSSRSLIPIEVSYLPMPGILYDIDNKANVNRILVPHELSLDVAVPEILAALGRIRPSAFGIAP